MKPNKKAYQNLLIAAAELHYFAAEEQDDEIKARTLVLAFDLERCVRELVSRDSVTDEANSDQKRPRLRVVYDANNQLID